MEEHSASYRLNINITPLGKKEITWQDTLNHIENKAIDKGRENIELPIYRYSILLDLMQYQVGCVVHEN